MREGGGRGSWCRGKGVYGSGPDGRRGIEDGGRGELGRLEVKGNNIGFRGGDRVVRQGLGGSSETGGPGSSMERQEEGICL